MRVVYMKIKIFRKNKYSDKVSYEHVIVPILVMYEGLKFMDNRKTSEFFQFIENRRVQRNLVVLAAQPLG